MSQRPLYALVLLGVLSGLALAAGPAADAKPYVFIVQTDLRPTIDDLDFAGGFAGMLKTLPAERQIKLLTMRLNELREIYAGPVSGLTWPNDGVQFAVRTFKTTPYSNLLQYLKQGGLTDTSVFVVAGVYDFYEAGKGSGNDRYMDESQPLTKLVNYCKKNKVRIHGFYVFRENVARGADTNVLRNHPTECLNAFQYVTESTNGAFFYNFNSFKGVFESAAKKKVLP